MPCIARWPQLVPDSWQIWAECPILAQQIRDKRVLDHAKEGWEPMI
jgi:hypothetical protein